MTSVNRPSVRMTRGNDSSQSRGRNSALKMPSNNEAANKAPMLWHSIPGTIWVATITATVLMSQRCRKFLRDADILSGGRRRWHPAQGFLQPFRLIREKVFHLDTVACFPGFVILLFVEIDFKQAELE